MREPINFGLVLSGGGVRGLAHVGVIKVLEEEGITPTFIAGTSAGAIVGAFYAAGYKSDEILSFFQETTMFSPRNYAYRKPGLIDTDKFYDIFKVYFPDDRFESLPKKLFVNATDVLTGTARIFEQGPLIKAVLASAAFPGVLSPVLIDGVLYADGAITDNFPVEPLLDHCEKIIGVYVSPLRSVSAKDLNTSRSVMERAFQIGLSSMSIGKFAHFDVLIAPEALSHLGTFSISQLYNAYEIGYAAAREQLENIRRLKE